MELRLTCLVDNCVALGAPLWGEHGLSFLVQREGAHVLWDTGQSGDVLRHNLEALNLASVPLAAVALSHAHNDHTGGLGAVAALALGAPVYAHADIARERYSQREGRTREVGLSAPLSALAQAGAWRLATEPVEIMPHVWTTGTIGERRFPLSAGAHLRAQIDGALGPDPFHDDLALVIETAKGLVLLLGCCHAGLRNTLAAVRARHTAPLLAIVGGAHLAEVHADELAAIAEALRAEGAPKLYLNHCTGDAARDVLRQALPGRVAPCPAGTMLEF
ncbi:MAG: MBL fold metallo-hydrolase [Chloroflexota bacterium]